MTTDLHAVIDDAERLLGPLSIDLLVTDLSPDVAASMAINRVTNDLGPLAVAKASELIARIAIAVLVGHEMDEDIVAISENLSNSVGLVDQAVMVRNLHHLVKEKGIGFGELTGEYEDVYEHDPWGLAWVMFTCASGLCALMTEVVAKNTDTGAILEGDEAPLGPNRATIDLVAWNLRLIREQLPS